MQPDLESVLRPLDGIAHLQDLLAAGYSRYEVASLHRRGRLVRPRIGWYVAPWHDPAVVAAVRVGGRLTCISAARSYGLPTPPGDGRVHVCLPPNASRLRSAAAGVRVGAGEDRAVVWHWGDADGSRSRVGVLECLRCASSCVPGRWFVGMVDAGLRSGLVGSSDLPALGKGLGEEKRALLSQCDSSAESILESLLRFGLRSAGIVPETQVWIGEHRVDFLLERWLVIECDGSEHHSGPAEFERDRRRDASLARAGYRVLRFSYR